MQPRPAKPARAFLLQKACRKRHCKNQKQQLYPRKDKEMDKHRNKNRSRKYGIVIHLSEDEKYILDEKTKCSNMASRADFIRHLIIYGYVYEFSQI
jgi:hypothetical protein